MLLYVHLGLMAVVVLITAAVVIPNWGTADRPIGAVLVASLPFWVLGVLSALLLSAKGAPTIEWILPLIAVLIAGICCRSDKAFKGLRWGLTGTAVVLWLNFIFLVNGGIGFTANPDQTRVSERLIQKSEIQAAGEAMRAKLAPDADYPAGPVGEILDDPHFDTVDTLTARSAWHTPLTRLYREDRAKAPLWYPGGEVAEASRKLEVRTR